MVGSPKTMTKKNTYHFLKAFDNGTWCKANLVLLLLLLNEPLGIYSPSSCNG